MDSSPFEERPRGNNRIPTPGNPIFGSPGPARNLFGTQRAPVNRQASAPSYDFLAPASTPPRPTAAAQQQQHPGAVVRAGSVSSRFSPEANGPIKPDVSNENLRSKLNAALYELSTLRDERELEKIRHEKEIRGLEAKVEEQGKRADEVETDKRFLFDQHKEVSEKLKKVKDQATNQKQDLERQIRRLKQENSEFRDTITYKDEEISSQHRQYRRQLEDLETRIKTLTRTNEEMKEEINAATRNLQDVQGKFAQAEERAGNLETEMLRVRAQTGDLETLGLLKKELAEQVNHIKILETTNRRQSAELKQLREHNKSIELLQEEKESLESKVRMMDDLRKELSETQLRVSILQDEKNSWSSYFQSEGLEFDSPESLAKALVKERMEKATLLEKAGRSNPALTQRDDTIDSLENESIELKAELEKMKESAAKDIRARRRLERQKALALKEAQFLREQLKSFTAEETVYMVGNYDEQKTKRIEELESLVEDYKKENEELQGEIAKKEEEGDSIVIGGKRPREDDDDQRIGQLTRKNRQLQDELEKLQQSEALARKEIEAQLIRVASLEGTSSRILQLKDNPTSRQEAIKLEQINSLREENRALLAQLEGRMDKVGKVVPFKTLENVRAEVKAMENLVAERDKRIQRLKEIWSAKSLEFREAAYSLFGWKMDFMPNGRVKVTHMFAGSDDQSIEFDGEKGTMKVSGGPNSLWQAEIKNNCAFWMARQSIPCLLSSILIEQYEKTTRAMR
ncbi:coiled-coil domain-containing protein mad1 [Rhizina undulata]